MTILKRMKPCRSVVITFAIFLALAPRLSAQLPTWTLSNRPVVLGERDRDLFQSIQYGRLLPDGRAVIGDVDGLFVHLYGQNGVRQAAMGRRGGGPGEFQSINGLWLTPDHKIGTWDPRARRITVFELDGRVFSTALVRAEGKLQGNLDIFLGAQRNGDVLLAAIHFDRPRGGDELRPERWMIGRFAVNGEFRNAVGETPGMVRMNRSPLPFTPVSYASLRGDSLWISGGYTPELEVRNSQGAVVRRIDLPWRVERPTDQRAILEDKLRAKRNGQFWLELLGEAPEPDRVPAVAGLLIDDRGFVWVKEYNPAVDALWLKGNALAIAPGGNWRVLSPDGRWVASIRLPSNLIPLDIRGNNLLGVARDELDIEQVVVHSITR